MKVSLVASAFIELQERKGGCDLIAQGAREKEKAPQIVAPNKALRLSHTMKLHVAFSTNCPLRFTRGHLHGGLLIEGAVIVT